MPPSDQEPRYRLVDSNDNVVGSLFVNGDGNVAIQDETATETEFNANGVTTPQLTTDAVRTETIGAEAYRYAGDFDGSDPDARLDNAISDAQFGTTVFLEKGMYDATRTISKDIVIVGVSGQSAAGSIIGAKWTLDGDILLDKIFSFNDGGSIIANSSNIKIQNSLFDGGFSTTFNSDFCEFVNNRGGSVTFASGTSSGIVDSCRNTTVTDNGSNTVGDIA